MIQKHYNTTAQRYTEEIEFGVMSLILYESVYMGHF